MLGDQLLHMWEEFAVRGVIRREQREPIATSWGRCRQLGVDLYREEAPIRVEDRDIEQLSAMHRGLIDVTSIYMEYLQYRLGSDRMMVALGDESGLLLKVLFGSSYLRKHAECRHFFGGAEWSEVGAGTNAVGTAVIEGRPVQVIGPEHYCVGWHEWMCSAVPIREPLTGTILGVLDISSPTEWRQCHDVPLLQSVAQRIGQDIQRNVSGPIWNEFVEIFGKPVFMVDRDLRVVCANTAAVQLGFRTGEAMPYLEGPEAPLRGVAKGGEVYRYRLPDRDLLLALRVFPYSLWGYSLGVVCVVNETWRVRAKSSARPGYGGWTVQHQLDSIIGNGPAIAEVKYLARKAAEISAPVFITGETGSGKELFAHAIHASGVRAKGPFVAINCGALSRDLAASELFGYEEGAFTGAKKHGHPGKLVLANGGTVFLDEIGDMPPDCQTLLLRFLEEGRVVPVGGSRPIMVDVRVIAATHKNLEEEVRAGRFREDLFYRLTAIWMRIPPLRERREDIPALAGAFARYFAEQMNKPQLCLSDEALRQMEMYSWPGNVRELRNVIQRAVFLCEESQIQPHHIQLGGPFGTDMADRPPLLQRVDRAAIECALRETNGNVSRAAAKLGVSRVTLYRKMKSIGLR
jgi:transcriptional regulator of acetoin/glycerol metabolism